METKILAVLKPVESEYKLTEVVIRDELFTIGRSSENDLRLPDPAVSRQHTRLRCAQGDWYIQDLQSSGGTFVNGQRVPATLLNDGDIIGVGKSTFLFQLIPTQSAQIQIPVSQPTSTDPSVSREGPAQISRPRSVIYVVIGLFALLLVVVGVVFVPYLLGKNAYDQGHLAYLQADCTTTLQRYEALHNQWSLISLDDYEERALAEQTECEAFQVAVDHQEDQEFIAALMAYADFVERYPDSGLVVSARENTAVLFEQSEAANLVSQEVCSNLEGLEEQNLIPDRETYLPQLYFACGQIYDQVESPSEAFAMYSMLLSEYPNHTLTDEAIPAILDLPLSCKKIETLKQNQAIISRTDLLPSLYHHCGQAYISDEDFSSAFDMYKALLLEYPIHDLASDAEQGLLANPIACEEIESIQETVITERDDFMPTLFYNCGSVYEQEQRTSEAIEMYDGFLSQFPEHHLATEIEEALALLIVGEAQGASAGDIPEPTRSGSTGSDLTEVVIQNDSPEEMRIIFSGPQSSVEELTACSTCEKHPSPGPYYCPEDGPIGRYTLQPGEYSIVVESISDEGVTPYTGTWNLASGVEYYHCFFIVVTAIP